MWVLLIPSIGRCLCTVCLQLCITYFRLLEERQPSETKLHRHLGSAVKCHIRVFVNTTRNFSINTDELEGGSTAQVPRIQR